VKPLKILYPLTFLYYLGFVISQKIRKHKQKKLPCIVISVGNITAGGTGKTPSVIFIAELLQEMRKKVCVISRGYKSKVDGTKPEIVTDGNKLYLGAKMAGDEPFLIARTLSDVPVIIDKNRYRAGNFALEKFGVDTLILDDGFQYLSLYRDVDIVCINALNPFGGFRLIPAGYLREKLRNLSRASAFFITRSDKISPEKLSEIERIIKKYNSSAPIFHAYFVKNIYKRNGSKAESQTLSGQNVIAISGIAVPEDFENTISELGVNLLAHKKYPDHYFFKGSDVKKFYDDAAEFQAVLITTAKDATRLPEDFPCYVLDVKIDVREKSELKRFLEERLG